MDILRSLLFVPGDSEKKIAKARGIDADAIIYDLEDAVMPERRAEARSTVADELRDTEAGGRFRAVRINAIDTRDAREDLATVVPAAPELIVLPKIRSVDDVRRCSAQLDELEARHGIVSGGIGIIAVATETPEILFAMGGLRDAGARLVGLSWGAEDLATALGARANKDANGEWLPPYQLARAQCLIAARACGAQPIDTVHADFSDLEGLRRSCAAAWRDGFTGKLAIHPNQVEAINLGFLPSSEEVEEARRVIAAFDASPGAGVVRLDGRMLDIPHLNQARDILAQAARGRGD